MKFNLKEKVLAGVMVLLMAAFFVPSFASAFQGGGHGYHGKGMGMGMGHHKGSPWGIWKNPKIVKELALTDDQVATLKTNDFAFREKQMALRSDKMSLNLSMEKLFANKPVDEAAVLATAKKISDVKANLFKNKIEARLAFEKVLSAEQIAKLKMLKHNRRGKMGKKGMGGHHGGGMGMRSGCMMK